MKASSAIALTILVNGTVLAAEPAIVGTWWEEESHARGYRVISIMTLRPDGTFTASFRYCREPNPPPDHVTGGHWTYVGRRLHTTFEFNGVVTAYDDYETDSIDGHIWTYHLVEGYDFVKYGPISFRDVRVSPDSKLPNCDTLS